MEILANLEELSQLTINGFLWVAILGAHITFRWIPTKQYYRTVWYFKMDSQHVQATIGPSSHIKLETAHI